MIKKILRKFLMGYKADSSSFVKHLRKKGVRVGENVRFYAPSKTIIDTQNPYLLQIGNNVNITHGVIILTHDFAWSVIKKSPEGKGRIIGCQRPVTIGNNVFIGMNAVICRGVTVGDNVIIGAGSIVTKNCDSDSVYAGNPAKKIMTLKEFIKKREEEQFEEAKVLAKMYKERFGVLPPKELFSEYFPLFCSAEEASMIPAFRSQMSTCANYEETFRYMSENKPMFNNYDEFLKECFR